MRAKGGSRGELSVTTAESSLAGMGLLSLPVPQQQPAHAHTAHLQKAQAKASAAEAALLEATLQTARTLMSDQGTPEMH